MRSAPDFPMQFHEHLTAALRVNGTDHKVVVDARAARRFGRRDP
jgi:hypothetical protein